MPTSRRLPDDLAAGRPLAWRNPDRRPAAQALSALPLTADDVRDAHARWLRWAPLLAALFPPLRASAGGIDSPLTRLPEPTARALVGTRPLPLWVKHDHALPLTGSIKARGGVFEVLWHAEDLALAAGLIAADADRAQLAGDAARRLFAGHRILVGSTGNLGFSVGLIGRALGFEVDVHMSHDAKAWKKDRLRALGARVVEHRDDYSAAVAAARQEAAGRADRYFVDDESSPRLFLGYAAAALPLADQLAAVGASPSPAAPLRVFLPCGVGGAPGGVAFGLKVLWGDAVRAVFVEPVAAPCMLLQLAAGRDAPSRSVREIGLDVRTVADGLAVGRASMLAARMMRGLLDGVVTLDDATMLRAAARLWDDAGLRLEPSAAAAFAAIAPWRDGPERNDDAGGACLGWTTGGAMLPDAVFDAMLRAGRKG